MKNPRIQDMLYTLIFVLESATDITNVEVNTKFNYAESIARRMDRKPNVMAYLPDMKYESLLEMVQVMRIMIIELRERKDIEALAVIAGDLYAERSRLGSL